MLKCDTEEDITNYLSFIGQYDVKKYIPTEELINYISSIRKKKYEEALRMYYTTRKDFIEIMKEFVDSPNNINYLYEIMKNKRVCISGKGCSDENNVFSPLMFYTVRVNDGGYLQQIFMHECGHIIDQSQKGVGFELFGDNNEKVEENSYDKKYRKYEKFNETQNDIFITEANKVLQSQGIYLIEPKGITKLDTSNLNTALITKNLLQPLLQKYRKQFIDAKINSKSQEFINFIGEDNFEELVDAVNKVDYLSRNGVVPKIDKFPEDPMVIEYFEQVERVKQIYINIDQYVDSHTINTRIGI